MCVRVLHESLTVGLPVIATNWSGPTAFMTPENSYPLSVERKLVKLPRDHVFKKHYWAQPSVGHLRSLMRKVVADPEEAAAKGAAVGVSPLMRCTQSTWPTCSRVYPDTFTLDVGTHPCPTTVCPEAYPSGVENRNKRVIQVRTTRGVSE